MPGWRFALGLLLVSCASPAAAQEGVDWSGLMMGIAHGTAMDEAAQESVVSNRRGSVRPAPAPVRLTYAPSPERRRANFARFIAKSRAQDPTGAAILEKELTTADPIDKMGHALAAYGMRIDDLGDTYAIWWLNAWLASRQRNDTPPARQIAAVRRQAGRAMASVREIATATDAAKQEMAEAQLIQAALIGSFMDQAQGKPEQFRQLAAAVRKGARAAGLDLDTMELTDDGFVPRRVGNANAGHGGTAVYAVSAVVAAGLIGGVWLARGRKCGVASRS